MSAAIRDAAARLAAASETPRLDAELLMAHALGVSREAILLGGAGDAVPADYAALVARRAGGEPLAYITGRRAFWTIELAVAPGVLIPRPDSETLIEAAVAHFGAAGPARVIDLGTGSGALLLAALDEWPRATGLGVDRSAAALTIATANAARLGLADRAAFQEGDWADGVDERFDLILCNPPYIESDAVLPRDVAEHEPASALFAGADGLDDYRRLAPQIARLLAPGGIGCIEIGAMQGSAVRGLMEAEGLATALKTDLAGHDRCVTVQTR
ncbi:peptide chain release factor N(5)-glutamine methyltransferase [Sphingomonas naphthae]|uniref:Release factor glutamine methyltransferase n=1 Tax=Sphingomonas naphthae TaxID=1813468 RepID=A0ABY7TQI5_9SPHN|nr:peptide chain release factor N(5)-glutamine methyltransferase [Sphingomonas naphthae]WCT75487.1 peptide chain release factor N(5)-glutamine methyltransferase [Sphingomonas naphthae]